RPATATTQITIRPAAPYEAASLQLAPGAYVLVRVTTTHTHAGQPVDQTTSVWPDTTTIYATNHPLT
ncbi:UTRA domain-containing protein, partial [Actinomadura sp. KC06]|uniref:UTRA domain-containing protein n=1 Tax=Actinomadura sp. KC06 TaxID=2530369 RepID=UPI00104C5BDB